MSLPSAVGTYLRGGTDASLARRIRSGDHEALGELYDLYAPVALGYAIHVVKDLKQAEDLVHDAFVTVWQQITKFDDTRDTMRSWVLRIVRSHSAPLDGAAQDTSPSRLAPSLRPKAAIDRSLTRRSLAAGLRPARILVIDDDQDVCEVVTAILGDEGYDVVSLEHVSDKAVRAAIGRIEPDCILLDGAQAVEYAEGWATAAEVRRRDRPIPTVMFTAHMRDAAEARLGTSSRAVAAGFAGVLPKPFTLDDLIATVEHALEDVVPFNTSERAEHERTAELVAQLTAAGAVDIRPSTRREWANFRNSSGEELQLYWWQSAGAYLVGRYRPDGARLELIGRYYGTEAAVRGALGARSTH